MMDTISRCWVSRNERKPTGYETQRVAEGGFSVEYGGFQDPVAQMLDTKPNYGMLRKKKNHRYIKFNTLILYNFIANLFNRWPIYHMARFILDCQTVYNKQLSDIMPSHLGSVPISS